CPRGPSERRRSQLSWSLLRARLKDREDDPFRCELVADHRAHLDLREAAPHLRDGRFEPSGVTGLDHPLETHLFDAREEPEPVAVVRMRHRGHCGDLRHALHEDDPRDDRVAREVAWLVPLLAGERVLTYRANPGLELDDSIYEQESVAVRDERFYGGSVKG